MKVFPFSYSNPTRIEDQFVVQETNVENLEEAQVVCLGENHHSIAHRLNNSKLINQIACENDILLTEYDERRGTSDAKYQVPYLSKRLSVHGWDTRSDLLDSLATRQDDLTDAETSLLEQIAFQTLPQRNQSLCNAVEKYAQTGRRVFVTAGFLHFCPSSGGSNPLQDQAYEETVSYLKTKKFAILNPKN